MEKLADEKLASQLELFVTQNIYKIKKQIREDLIQIFPNVKENREYLNILNELIKKQF
jgi:hypothetical protein